MKPSLIDVPVALIFFVRPDAFRLLFDEVKKARPSKLFLIQDGHRENRPDDIEKIKECRKIAEDIGWECEVYRNYSDVNLGCGMRPASGISWVFDHVDRAIILEDDCIPDQSFFPYCAELLEKYKDDNRIGAISGFNHFKDWNCGNYSYFFTKAGSTWGWATWKRIWNDYDYSLSNIKIEYLKTLLVKEIYNKKAGHRRIFIWEKTRNLLNRGVNISWWDHQFGFLKYSQSFLTIVPKSNMIHNVGIGAGSTHAEDKIQNGWKKGEVCFMPIAPIELPLKHPNFIICDRDYDEKYFRTMAYISIFRKIIRKIKKVIG